MDVILPGTGGPKAVPDRQGTSLAVRIEAESKSVTICGDAVDCSGLDALAKNTDALVTCCYLSQIEMMCVKYTKSL